MTPGAARCPSAGPGLLSAALLGFGACSFLAPALSASDESNITVVASKVSDDYVRAKMPDGSYKPEAVVFGEGGHWTGAVDDPTLQKVVFLDVAKAVIGPLAKQGYVSTKDPKATRALIMVYWGRTATPHRFDGTAGAQLLQAATTHLADHKALSNQAAVYSEQIITPPAVGMPCGKFDPDTTVDQITGQIDADNAMVGALALTAAQNRSRDQEDARNASLLGYDSWWNATAKLEGTPLQHRRQDMLDELEQDRYFVILMAYDFQVLWRHKKHKLLWETRFSVNQRGVEFDQALPLMAQNAARYFGEDSHGLIRDTLPAGRVDVGQLQTLGVVASK